ncbi:hypothetical protein ACHAWO_006586 [Cyclotella atomus]|uniref:F5/8 type C domain-containing protein n=1 Tax=Cyclotella atomus TaxID=382360 RepID=A0ABD3NNF0_9STRA
MLLNNLLPVTAVLALFTIAHVQGTTATTTSTGFATTQGTTQGTTTVTTTYGTTTQTTTATTAGASSTTTTAGVTSSPTGAPTASCYPSADKVRINALMKNMSIQLFEVEAFLNGVNVALRKAASQSSTYGNNQRFRAAQATDGLVDYAYSFTHTGNVDTFGWLEIDLQGTYPIDSVVIYNRWCGNTSDPSGCLCRLSHSALLLLDNNDQWVASEFIGDTCGRASVQVNFPCAI